MSNKSLESRASVPNSRVLIAFAISTLFAGANAVAVRFTVAELAPFWGAAIRFSVAALLFWLIALVRRRSLPRGADLWATVLYGLIGFGFVYAFIYWGLRTVPAGMAQIILALAPLFTFGLSLLQRLERFHWRGLAGALIAVAGIVLSFREGVTGNIPLLPMLAVVAAAACIAESSIVLKRARTRPDPVAANAIGMTAGAIFLLILSRVSAETWVWPQLTATWISILYLVVIGSMLVFALFVYVLARWTASAASYQLVLMPFVTVVLGALLRGETVNPLLLVGGALVLIGVWVGALSGTSRSAAAQPREIITSAGEAD